MRKLQMKKAAIMLLLILVAGALVVDYAITGNTTKDETIRIGIILPLTGNAANYGEASQRGMEVAMQEIIEDYPNFRFETYYEDSTFTAQKGVEAYANLRVRGVDAVITAASHVSLAIAPMTIQDNVLQMAIFASAGKYSSPNDLTFRVSAKMAIEAGTAAEVIGELGHERLGIIYLNNDFGLSFKNDLTEQIANQKIEVDIVGEEPMSMGDSDFRTVLLKLKERGADSIFLVGLAKQYVSILEQAKELGLDVQFMSMRSAEDPVLIENAGELAEGLIYTYSFDQESDNVEEFVDTFRKKYNRKPDAYASEGYEGLKLVALSFVNCGKDYECIGDYLRNLRDYESLFGPLSFDTNGDVYYEFFPKVIKDGKFVRWEG